MLAIIGLATWLGDYIDSKQSRDFPLFTVVLSLIGVFASLYLVIKEVNKSDPD
jgi:F0F1-type ATP synthase assembly protein I